MEFRGLNINNSVYLFFAGRGISELVPLRGISHLSNTKEDNQEWLL
jgi:hypothetical protein